jgi:hypothetical protein
MGHVARMEESAMNTKFWSENKWTKHFGDLGVYGLLVDSFGQYSG